MPSIPLPSPDNDYAAPDGTRLDLATWDAVMGSIGARLRAAEAIRATFQELIDAGTDQALEMIGTNVEPQLSALKSTISGAQTDLALLQDQIARLTGGGAGNISPLLILQDGTHRFVTDAQVSDWQGRVTAAQLAAAISNLVNGAGPALDQLNELAAALGNDPNFAATVLARLSDKASLSTANAFAGDLTLTSNNQRVWFKSPDSDFDYAILSSTGSLYVQKFGKDGTFKSNSFMLNADDTAYHNNNISVQNAVYQSNGDIFMPWANGFLSQVLETKISDAGKSFGASGYVKFGNGLIVQWGRGVDDQAITFPVAFPNAAVGVWCTAEFLQDVANVYAVYVSAIAASGFTGRYRYASGGATGNVTSAGWYWLAMGY